MAKELLIVFVYDCEMCKKEEDDPQDAIVYFYPTWVSREQRHALCSQLMGVTQFFLASFSLPKIISLQSGKFAIKKLGRYILCVGTDRNIPDIVLELRSKTLYKLLRLFHFDIESLETTLTEDDDNLSERLAELFQVYLPILQFATNKFGNIPVFNLPKSANNIFLEAMQILKSFQEVHGVLGGVILYQNKVVATQLNYNLTKHLVVSDPYRIKLPADTINTPFHLPVGVQLLSMYIEQSEVNRLQEQNANLLSALKEVSSWRKELEATAIPKAGKAGGLKRDTSRIFSTVMEEEVPDVVKEAVRARQLARLESVAPATFVLAPPPPPSVSSTTDSLPPTTTTNLPIRYYSLGLPNVESDWCDEIEKPKGNQLRPYYNTICDPKYPLFKSDGLPVSESLFQLRLTGHYDRLKSIESTPKKKNSGFSSSSRGVPLTPLMAKLSMLAQEETPLRPKTPAIPKTPLLAPKTPAAPPSEAQCKGRQKGLKGSEEIEDLIPVVLYIFGHNNTALLLAIEPSVAVDPERIHSLWERSVTMLSEVDAGLESCDGRGGSDSGEGEYSYVVVDPAWGPIQRGGPYQPHQLQLLTILHQALTSSPNFTDILLRTDDTVSYGYQCGESQVYYQQNCTGWGGGLPTPADLMGVVALKARRRLERDHGIVLL